MERNKMVKRGMMFWCYIGKGEGSEQCGDRIVTIIQNDVGNKFSPTVIVAIGTSQLHKAKLPTHVLITKSKYISLPKDTVVMAEQVRTFDKIRLGDCVGILDEKDLEKLDLALKVSISLQDTSVKKIENHNERIEDIKSKLLDIDGYIRRWIYKGGEIIKLQSDMKERHSYICELKTECKKNNINYEDKYDDMAIPRFLESVVNEKYNKKEMVG